MIVGFVELLKEEKTFKLRGDIERLLRSNWLDHQTSTEFEEQLRKRRSAIDLVNLKTQIEAEIKFRKNNYSL